MLKYVLWKIFNPQHFWQNFAKMWLNAIKDGEKIYYQIMIEMSIENGPILQL